MKRLGLGLISLLILIGLSGCNGKPIDNLKANLSEYKECMVNNDFECQVEFMDLSSIEEITGEKVNKDALINQLKSSGIKVKSVQMNTPTKIISSGDTLSSTVSYSILMDMQGQELKQNASINAISKDDGNTWLFNQSL